MAAEQVQTIEQANERIQALEAQVSAGKGRVWYLHNVGYREWAHSEHHGFYRIPKPNREAGEVVATSAPIEEGVQQLDIGDDNQYSVPHKAELKAKDIGRQFAKFGVFASPNKVPTKAEIAGGGKALEKFLQEKLLEGDATYGKFGDKAIQDIDDWSKFAAVHFGLDRGYVAKLSTGDRCPYCQANTRLDVAFCPSGCVLDIDKAVAAGRITKGAAEELREARGPKTAKKAS